MKKNRFVNKVNPYKISSHKAWEYEDRSNVLKLDWNESTIPPNPNVLNAVKNALQEPLNWYPDTLNKDLLNALSNYTGAELDNIQYFSGSDAAHECIIRVYLDPGDVVTIVAPTYDNFRAVTESLGGVIKQFRLQEDFSFDVTTFEEHIGRNNSKIVYICNPNNPTGTEYTEKLIRNQLMSNPEVLFIIDEAYFEFGNSTAANLINDHKNVIVTRTFSKAFGLASFRIGYILAHNDIIKDLHLVRNVKSVSLLSQISAIAAIENFDYTRDYIIEVLKSKKIFFRNMLELKYQNLKLYSGGGNFLLIRLEDKGGNFLNYLAQNDIFIRDLDHIKGLENCVRITIGTVAQMNRVFLIVKKYFA